MMENSFMFFSNGALNVFRLSFYLLKLFEKSAHDNKKSPRVAFFFWFGWLVLLVVRCFHKLLRWIL